MRISDWSSDVVSSDLRLDQLDPVAVGILDEGDVAHAAVAELLLERYAQRFHPRAGGAHVGHADADVAEAARFAVAVVVDRPGLRLGAVVVGQFEHAALARQPLAAILV